MRTESTWKTIGVAAAIGGMLGLGVIGCGSRESEEMAATGEQAAPSAIVQACEVFTPDMARQLLGESAKESEISSPFSGSSEDIEVSTCTYEAEDPASPSQIGAILTATVLLRGARTEYGRSANRYSFEQNQTQFQQSGEATEEVSGLGNAAFYVGGVTNQLHALLDEGRYHMIASSDDPGDDRAGASERLARMVVERL